MRHLVTTLMLISAGMFYAIGFGSGVITAVFVAIGLEILFWTRTVRFGRPWRNL